MLEKYSMLFVRKLCKILKSHTRPPAASFPSSSRLQLALPVLDSYRTNQTFSVDSRAHLQHAKVFANAAILNLKTFTSHHRVHHGRNPYCIDKNYAAVLIIWDRLFGTFAAEREDEPVVYGLVTPIETYDPIAIQCKYYNELFWYCASGKFSLSQKLQKCWYGPGWNIEEQKPFPIPEVPKGTKVIFFYKLATVFDIISPGILRSTALCYCTSSVST